MYAPLFFNQFLGGLLSGLLHRTYLVRNVKALTVKFLIPSGQTSSMIDSIDQNSRRLRLAYSTFQTNPISPDMTRACSKVGRSEDRSRDGFGRLASPCLFIPSPVLPSCLCINSSRSGRLTLATPFWCFFFAFWSFLGRLTPIVHSLQQCLPLPSWTSFAAANSHGAVMVG